MPIMIPNGLPAAKTLAAENIFVMNETRAVTQDIRPLQILVLNLMPTKIATETQLSRLLGNTPLQVELELIHTDSHESKNTSREHLLKFYQTFEDVKERWFDGLIITGAPVEQMPFEQVEYWPELCRIMEWSRTHVHSTFHICWGAQAALYHHYGVRKVLLSQKMFGVFHHHVVHKGSILFRGFDDDFLVPHSRHTGIIEEDVRKCSALKVLAESKEAGIYAISTDNGRQIFITGHSEYDTNTLRDEYLRDKNEGLAIQLPQNYFAGDDDTKAPACTWRSCDQYFGTWHVFKKRISESTRGRTDCNADGRCGLSDPVYLFKLYCGHVPDQSKRAGGSDQFREESNFFCRKRRTF